jgi:hypothetical protein
LVIDVFPLANKIAGIESDVCEAESPYGTWDSAKQTVGEQIKQPAKKG